MQVLRNLFEDPALLNILIGVGILVGSGIIGKLLKGFLSTSLIKILIRTKNTLDDRIVNVLSKNVFALCLIGGTYIGIEEVRSVLDIQRRFEHRLLDYATVGMYIILVLALARLVAQIIKATAEWYAEDLSIEKHKDISSSIPLASKIVNIILLTIAFLIILDHIGVNVGSMLVSLGVGSLAVALAAQETISNLIAWFVIVIDQPFRVGDQVRLASGEEGNIHQIGLRATRILNFDNNIIVVPNAEIVKSRLVNYNIPATISRILVELTVAYGTDIDKARMIMVSLAAKNPRILDEPAPQVFVMNFTDVGVFLRLAARSDLTNKFDAETSLREEIYTHFQQEGIKFAVPQRINTMVKGSNES